MGATEPIDPADLHAASAPADDDASFDASRDAIAHAAAWLPGGGKHLTQGRPEAQGPLPDRQL